MSVSRSQRQHPSYYALRMGCGEQLGLSLKLSESTAVAPRSRRGDHKSGKGRKA